MLEILVVAWYLDIVTSKTTSLLSLQEITQPARDFPVLIRQFQRNGCSVGILKVAIEILLIGPRRLSELMRWLGFRVGLLAYPFGFKTGRSGSESFRVP